jgi:hypothetical protein
MVFPKMVSRRFPDFLSPSPIPVPLSLSLSLSLSRSSGCSMRHFCVLARFAGPGRPAAVHARHLPPWHRRRDGGYRRCMGAVAADGAPKEVHRMPERREVQGLPLLPISVQILQNMMVCSPLRSSLFVIGFPNCFSLADTFVLPNRGRWLPSPYIHGWKLGSEGLQETMTGTEICLNG